MNKLDATVRCAVLQRPVRFVKTTYRIVLSRGMMEGNALFIDRDGKHQAARIPVAADRRASASSRVTWWTSSSAAWHVSTNPKPS